jgi:hypothetical protein
MNASLTLINNATMYVPPDTSKCIDVVNQAIIATSHNFNTFTWYHISFCIAAFVGLVLYHTKVHDWICKDHTETFIKHYNQIALFLLQAGVVFALATALDLLNKFGV